MAGGPNKKGESDKKKQLISGRTIIWKWRVNGSIQFCMILGETLPIKATFNHALRHD